MFAAAGSLEAMRTRPCGGADTISPRHMVTLVRKWDTERPEGDCDKYVHVCGGLFFNATGAEYLPRPASRLVTRHPDRASPRLD